MLLPGFDVRSEADIARATEASTAVFNLIGAREATRNFSLSDVNVAAAERVARVSARSPAGVERFVHFSCVGAGAASPSEIVRRIERILHPISKSSYSQVSVLN